MDESAKPPGAWWGEATVAPGAALAWRVGPFSLWVHRDRSEWRFAHAYGEDRMASLVEPAGEADPSALDAQANVLRVAGDSSGTVDLVPRLGPRSVIARPEGAFSLLPGREGGLFLSTLLWLRIDVGRPPAPALELPMLAPASSWFGPSPVRGELCHSVQTRLRRRFDDLPDLPHRAVTKVVLRNRARESLRVERLNLPVPSLTLYRDAHGGFWTQVVEIERSGAGHHAEVRFGPGPPAEAEGAVRVEEPRKPAGRNVLVQALSSLLD